MMTKVNGRGGIYRSKPQCFPLQTTIFPCLTAAMMTRVSAMTEKTPKIMKTPPMPMPCQERDTDQQCRGKGTTPPTPKPCRASREPLNNSAGRKWIPARRKHTRKRMHLSNAPPASAHL